MQWLNGPWCIGMKQETWTELGWWTMIILNVRTGLKGWMPFSCFVSLFLCWSCRSNREKVKVSLQCSIGGGCIANGSAEHWPCSFLVFIHRHLNTFCPHFPFGFSSPTFLFLFLFWIHLPSHHLLPFCFHLDLAFVLKHFNFIYFCLLPTVFPRKMYVVTFPLTWPSSLVSHWVVCSVP